MKLFSHGLLKIFFCSFESDQFEEIFAFLSFILKNDIKKNFYYKESSFDESSL